MPIDRALDLVEMLARTGRAVPAGEWVDGFVEARIQAKIDFEVAHLPHNIF